MKKLGLFVMTLVLALGMTCCKKTNVDPTPVSNNKVYIELNTGNSGSRLGISESGSLTWSTSDKLWVYSSVDGLLGSISYNGSNFTGEVTAWTDKATLNFYYLGDYTPTSGKTLTIDFSDQSYSGAQSIEKDLANIARKFWVSASGDFQNVNAPSYGMPTYFTTTMKNQVSMGIFNTSDFGSGNVKIYAASNLKNQITISDKGVLSYGVAGTNLDSPSGHIITGPASEKRYVVLLPSDNVDVTLQFTSQSKTGSYEIGTIEASKLYTAGSHNAISITASDVVSSYVDLAVASDHVFSVANGKTVKFAQGNLVYDQGRFKMHATQTAYIWNETWSSHVVGGTFDHFAFGTSCWNNGSDCYMPYMDKTPATLGPTDGSSYYNLTGSYANADWGVYQFGMNTGTSWRTLTQEEWGWLLGPYNEANPGTNCRSLTNRFLKAALGEQCGLIIFPDDFTTTGIVGSYTYNVYGSGSISQYNPVSDEDWAAMEAAGAIFLRTAGRLVTSYEDYLVCPNSDGNYWASSNNNTSQAYILAFWYASYTASGGVKPQANDGTKQYMYSVRLVQDVD